jgi:hypothetical protein
LEDREGRYGLLYLRNLNGNGRCVSGFLLPFAKNKLAGEGKWRGRDCLSALYKCRAKGRATSGPREIYLKILPSSSKAYMYGLVDRV